MNLIDFKVEGCEAVFQVDKDAMTDYVNVKAFARATTNTLAFLDAVEVVFCGRDEEYVSALGGKVDDLNRLVEAASEAANAKN